MKVIRKYAQKSNMATEIMSLRNIERNIIAEKYSKKQQTKITTYFYKLIHTGTVLKIK